MSEIEFEFDPLSSKYKVTIKSINRLNHMM